MKYSSSNKNFFVWIGIFQTVIALILSCFIVPIDLFSQTPVIKWDRTLGGSSFDGGDFGILESKSSRLQITHDGGYIFGGSSTSNISGDKTEDGKGSYDYWLIKLDASGNKIWDKTFGGSSLDGLVSLQKTSDGGFILGGYSGSPASGDKSEDSKGGDDYWIVKLDASGNKTWDKTIGGSGEDRLSFLRQTSDGGFILGGYSNSPASGDKSENSKGPYGSYDYWVVKLDASGNKIWDNTIGGSSLDVLLSLQQTSDGGFILGGYSVSSASEDKSENSKGSYDYWVVKLDASGNKIWDKTIGGSDEDCMYALQQTSDGGFILGGYSFSPASGDKSENNKGSYDYWVVKLDANGNKIWDKTIGGFGSDIMSSVQQTSDGEFILGGNSWSTASGDKTENSKGGNDYWVVKLDGSGNKIWDKTIGGSSDDLMYAPQQSSDGGFILGGYSSSPISGDKSEECKGSLDYWIVKLEANNCTSSSLAVTIPDAYAVNPGGAANTIYLGYGSSSLTFEANGNGGTPGYIYNWNSPYNNVIVQATIYPNKVVVIPDGVGTYTLKVTAVDENGCEASYTKTYYVVDIRSDIKKGKIWICHRDLKGKWTTLSVLASSVADHLAHGDYLGICNNNSSNSEILTRAANETGGQEIIQKGFKIFPNPATHFLDVQWTTKNTSQTSIRILNAEGKTVKSITTQGAVNQQRISLNGLAKGVYMLVLKTGADQKVSKFMIQ